MAAATPEINSISEFSWNIMGQMTQDSDPNLICCPLSIMGAFGMLLTGARSHSADQLRRALRLSSSPQAEIELGQILSTLPTSGERQNDAIIALANRAYVQAGYKLKEQFLATIQANFKAEIGQVDFGDSPTAAAEINEWVEKKTNNKIKDLIPPSGIDPAARLILVNAVYFKGLWQCPFKASYTSPAPFHTSPTHQYKVDMMELESTFSATENQHLGVQVVSLPFKGNRFTMLILLPTQMGQLAEVEQKLTSKSWADLVGELKPEWINLQLPRFKVESQFELKETFESIGVVDIFDPIKADLSGICAEPLFVTKAIHKAYLDVNEEGAEAAAATAIMLVGSALVDPGKLVCVNHPFIVVVYDVMNKAAVFIGRVTAPPKATEE